MCKNSFINFLKTLRQKALISSSIRFRTITQAASAEKIQRIVNDISQLTLIEVAELNQVLKTTLKIPDAPVMAYGAGPAAGPVVAKDVNNLKILQIFSNNILTSFISL
jgi:large subunit ribosomal protein L7/L12